jgi:uncharacterized protein (DUF736 family)
MVVAEIGEQYNVEVVERTEQYIDVKVADASVINKVSGQLIAADVVLGGINKLERSLEDIYIEITGGGGNQIA